MGERPDEIFHLETTQWKLNEQRSRDSRRHKGGSGACADPSAKRIPAGDRHQNEATDRAMKVTVAPTVDLIDLQKNIKSKTERAAQSRVLQKCRLSPDATNA